MGESLDPKDLELVGWLENVTSTIVTSIQTAKHPVNSDPIDLARRINALRDEASHAKEADLPAIFDQLNSLKALYNRKNSSTPPNPMSPFFAHMKLQESHATKDILLGHKTYLECDVPVIDWRHAPIAKIFFKYRKEDEYEEKLPGRVAKGIVIERHIISFHKGELAAIITPGRSLVKKDGVWQVDSAGASPKLQGGVGTAQRGHPIGTGQTGGHTLEVSALLDKSQYEILTKSSIDPLLILGGAGSGKTTVATHRLASLAFSDSDKYPEEQIGVIVPDYGLAHLTDNLLKSLGLQKSICITYDDWVCKTGRRIMKGLPRKVCSETPASVVKFKKHAAFKKAMEALIEDQWQELCHQVARTFPSLKNFQESILAIAVKAPNMSSGIDQVEAAHLAKGKDNKRKTVIRQFYTKWKKKLLEVGENRQDILLNTRYLDIILQASGGDLTEGDKASVLAHSVSQMAADPTYDMDDIDQDRLATVDGRNLASEAKKDPVYKTIDAEDFTWMIHLLQLKLGSHFRWPNQWAHLVVDEAQDFAPLELELMASSVGNSGDLTIAGDAHQQIKTTSLFQGWQATLHHLGASHAETHQLNVTYRSTKQVAEFAHAVLGEFAPPTPPEAKKVGSPVSLSRYPSEAEATMLLAEALTDLMIDEPLAYVAVITRDELAAKKLFEALVNVPKIRLIEGGDFQFVSGVEVTHVAQIKGLEFDYVVIPDATRQNYPDTGEARRLLHVAATRAIHQLWIITYGTISPIIPTDLTGQTQPSKEERL